MKPSSFRLPALGVVLGLIVAAQAGLAQPGKFPLKEKDVVVMLGDSITAQHLHSNYIEAYCVTRFPKWKLEFRNAGVSGSTVPSALARFDGDVALWKPTVVTIELGMNDAGAGPRGVENYLNQMKTLVQRVEGLRARPVFLTASPVNDGTTGADMQGRNFTLDKMATGVVKLADEIGLPCADQYHALVELWQANLKKGKDAIPLGGDPVHPAQVGQLTMAHACLVGLNAPALVSTATLDATGKVVAAEQCAITEVEAEGGGLAFTRTDDCLPMPIPADARAALKLVPLTEKLNRYTLTVTGLKAGRYRVVIDDVPVAEVSGDELGRGWNLSELTKGPIADQCQQVLLAIGEKSRAVAPAREVAKYQVPAWLKDLSQEIEAKRQAEIGRLTAAVSTASARINELAQPKPHRFQIVPLAD